MEENFNNEPQDKVEKEVAKVRNKQPKVNDEEPLVEKLKKKRLKIAIGILVILIITAIGAFFIFKSQRTAPKYIDTKVKDLKKSIEETLSSKTVETIGSLDFTNEEVKAEGKVKMTATGNTFGELNNTELNFNLNESFVKEYIDAKINAKVGEEEINGGIALDGETIYLDIKDVTSTPVKMEMEESLFDELKQEVNGSGLEEYKELLDLNNLKDFSIKSVNFLGEALKETITSTKSKGLNVEYEFTFDSESIKKAIDKFTTLSKNDAKYTDFIKKLSGNENITFDGEISTEDKMIVKIEVNLFTNKLNNLTIIYNDKTVLSKVDKDQYKLKYDFENEKNYAMLTIKDNEFKVTVYNEGKQLFSLESTSKKKEATLKLTINQIGATISLTVKKISDNEEKLSIDANVLVATIKADITTKTNNNKLTVDGLINVKLLSILTGSDENLKVEFSGNYERGKNLVTKEDYSNAVLYEKLDETSKKKLQTFLNGLTQSLNSFSPVNSFEDDFDMEYDYPLEIEEENDSFGF